MIHHDRFIVDEEESARLHDPVYVKDKYRTPRQADVQTRDDAIKNADRFQRMFMRTLRALRDLRRYAAKITIHNEGQVNIGQNQVNQAG